MRKNSKAIKKSQEEETQVMMSSYKSLGIVSKILDFSWRQKVK